MSPRKSFVKMRRSQIAGGSNQCGFLTFMWWRGLLAGTALKTGLVNLSFAAAYPIERLAMNDVQLFRAVARCGLASTKDEQSWAMATSMLAIKALFANPA
jgi:hypothetical protein